METILQFLSPETIYGLGLMILHILWQGCVIALLLGIFLIAMKRSSAQSRYTLSIVSLSLFPLLAIITFINAFQNAQIAFSTTSALSSNHAAEAISSNLAASFIEMYKNYLPIIVFLWFLGMTILMLRYLGLLIYVERLKNYLVEPVKEKLQDKINQISHQYQISRQIKSLISEKVTTPMVIGHLKPVLLIPNKAIVKLSDEEMEVVLNHELAHIKRNDYLVNILQNIIEIIFFFHPAAWWISSIVRKEREECCDVFAAKSDTDKIILAQALTTIQELNITPTTMAVSLLNKKDNLFNRINNLFNKNGMATFKEGLVVALFFIFSIGLMAFVDGDKNQTDQSKKEVVSLESITSVMANGIPINALVDSNGTAHEVYLKGKRVHQKHMQNMQAVVDSILYSWEYEEIMRRKAHENAKNNTQNIQYVPATKTAAQNPQNYNRKNKENVVIHTNKNGLYFTVNDDGEKVYMNAGQNGFSLNVDDGNDKVNMSAGHNGFNLNVDDGSDKVNMNAGINGFTLDVDDGGEKVQMGFGPNGFYINVVENGESVFKMDAGANGVNMKVSDE